MTSSDQPPAAIEPVRLGHEGLPVPPARCGALNQNGAQCRARPVPDGWTCLKHAGWSETASEHERHRLSWLEILEGIEHLAKPRSAAELWLASAERRLQRLSTQEAIRHGQYRIGGSALESDLAEALTALAHARQDSDMLRALRVLRRHLPLGQGFDPECRCSSCQEMAGAQLVPWARNAHGRRDGTDLFPYRTFRAASDTNKGLQDVETPPRATSESRRLMALQAAYIQARFPIEFPDLWAKELERRDRAAAAEVKRRDKAAAVVLKRQATKVARAAEGAGTSTPPEVPIPRAEGP